MSAWRLHARPTSAPALCRAWGSRGAPAQLHTPTLHATSRAHRPPPRTGRTGELLEAGVAVDDGVVGDVGVGDDDGLARRGERLVAQVHRLRGRAPAADVRHHAHLRAAGARRLQPRPLGAATRQSSTPLPARRLPHVSAPRPSIRHRPPHRLAASTLPASWWYRARRQPYRTRLQKPLPTRAAWVAPGSLPTRCRRGARAAAAPAPTATRPPWSPAVPQSRPRAHPRPPQRPPPPRRRAPPPAAPARALSLAACGQLPRPAARHGPAARRHR